MPIRCTISQKKKKQQIWQIQEMCNRLFTDSDRLSFISGYLYLRIIGDNNPVGLEASDLI